jgi:hypothetical protein
MTYSIVSAIYIPFTDVSGVWAQNWMGVEMKSIDKLTLARDICGGGGVMLQFRLLLLKEFWCCTRYDRENSQQDDPAPPTDQPHTLQLTINSFQETKSRNISQSSLGECFTHLLTPVLIPMWLGIEILLYYYYYIIILFHIKSKNQIKTCYQSGECYHTIMRRTLNGKEIIPNNFRIFSYIQISEVLS